MADYKKSELLIRLGEYKEGADRELDVAVKKRESISDLLRQASGDFMPWERTRDALQQLAMA
jgi:type III secretion protein N (ATPase)